MKRQGGVKRGKYSHFCQRQRYQTSQILVTLSLLAKKTFYSGKFFIGLYDDFLDLQMIFTLIFY